MQTRIYTAILAVAAMLLLASPANATVIEEASLHADGSVQTWQSRDFHQRHIYVYLYAGQKRLTQFDFRGCGASYGGFGVLARVKILGCHAPKDSRVSVRYVSVAGKKPLRVEITDIR